MKNNEMFWNIDRIMKLIIGLMIAAAVILLVNYLRNALLPFFVACFIAYMLQPIVEINRKCIREKGRTISSLLAIIEVTSIIGIIIYLFMPSVMSELETLGNILRDVENGKKPLSKEFSRLLIFIQQYFNPSEIKETLSEFHIDALISKGSDLLGESISVIVQVLGWAMTLIYVIFILIDYPQISRGFKLIFPFKYRDGAVSIVHEVQDSMNRYFRGQGSVALCAMIGYCIGFTVIGLPLSIPMGILVGVLYMIPYFQYITIIPIALICGIYSLSGAESFISLFGESILIFVIVQPICDYIITPRIMGKAMGLNPAMILLALSVWGSLMGIIGMIIALPATSLIMSYYEKYISNPHNKSSV